MSKKIVITKNGYEILKIIEWASDAQNCEFKIIPSIDTQNINIYYMKLFSKGEFFQFDKNKNLEITYHKATLSKPTKIHLKMIDKQNKEDVVYKTLPLDELLDPDINTEIPIPLLKIIIPDNVLTKKYQPKKTYKQFDIQDNNIIEIYMTKSKFIQSDFSQKWKMLDTILLGNSMEYFATGLDKYIAQNIYTTFYNKEHVRNVCITADVTNNIGIRINTIRNPNIRTDKMNMLFIENKAYLGFLGGPKVTYKDSKITKRAYEYDLENPKYFYDKEKEKWKYIFQREMKKLDNLIKKSNGKYQKQFKEYDDFCKHSKM